jgi:DNA-binding transcriptional regulator YiaG
MTFAEELKAWRGNRKQAEVCGELLASVHTYRAWERGVNVPGALALEQLRWLMKPVEYRQAVKRVADEMWAARNQKKEQE